jgi:hypothetical protein
MSKLSKVERLRLELAQAEREEYHQKLGRIEDLRKRANDLLETAGVLENEFKLVATHDSEVVYEKKNNNKSNNRSLMSMIIDFLNDKPLNINDLYQRLIDNNWFTISNNPKKLLGVILSSNKDKFQYLKEIKQELFQEINKFIYG